MNETNGKPQLSKVPFSMCVQISMDRVRALDSELATLKSTSNAAALQSSGNANNSLPTITGLSSATNTRDNTQHLQLLQQEATVTNELVAELRTQIRNLEREKEQLQAQIRGLQSSLSSCQTVISLAGQPHSFLLQQLQAAKDAAAKAETQALAATTALKAKEQEAGSARKEIEGLKADLQAVLQSRGQLQGLKQLLLRTMGVPLPSTSTFQPFSSGTVDSTAQVAGIGATNQYQQLQQQGGVSGGGSRIPQPVARPPTTIIGEGQ